MNAKLPDLMLSVFARTMADSAGDTGFVVDLATAGRYLPELIGMIGVFYQDIPVRIDVTGSFEQTVNEAGRLSLALGEHQAVARRQFESVTGQVSVRPTVAFSYQQATERPTQFGYLKLEQIDIPRPETLHDLEFWARRTPNGLVAQIDFRSDRVDATAVALLLQSLRQDINALVDGNTEPARQKIAGLFVEGQAERSSRRGFLSRLLSGGDKQ